MIQSHITPAILTKSGGYFDFINLDKSFVSIDDIAHALSHICRFTGHSHTFYSVAEHSVRASYVVPESDALSALMHDISESYLGDVSSPLKSLLPDYKRIELQIEMFLFKHFNIEFPLPESVKHADLVMLATEKRDLLDTNKSIVGWEVIANISPLDEQIMPMSIDQARKAFLSRYHELTEQI